MEYYKTLELGNFEEYGKDFLKYYNENTTNFIPKNSFWNPLKPECMNHCLTNNPVFAENIACFGEIKQLAILILHKQSDYSLHIDADFQRGVLARLNIPLLNCKGSHTAFFDYDLCKKFEHHIGKSATTVWNSMLRDKLKPVAEIELLQPTILKTSTPHTVYCNTCEFPRIALTISFENDIVNRLVL